MSALAPQIDVLYRLFSVYPLRSRLNAADPGCVSKAESRILDTTPLNALSADFLSSFADRLWSRCSAVADFKHFLPRLLDLLANDPQFGITAETLGFALDYNAFRAWPDSERQAVDAMLLSLWARAVDESRPLLDLLGCLAWMHSDITSHLAMLDADSALPGRVAALVIQCATPERKPPAKRRLSDKLWSTHPAQRQQLYAWLLRPPLAKRLSLHAEALDILTNSGVTNL